MKKLYPIRYTKFKNFYMKSSTKNLYLFYHNHNLLKIIYQPFDEKTGDNLLRFFCKQIVNGLEILERSDYIHYDIKPENLLITINLIIKLSDFSLISKAIDGNNIAIPGVISHTVSFVTPQYFQIFRK